MYTNLGLFGFNIPPSNWPTFPSLYNSLTSFNSNLISSIHLNPKSFSYIFESIVGIFQLGTSTFSLIAGLTLCSLLSVLVNVPNVLAKLVAGRTTSALNAVFVIWVSDTIKNSSDDKSTSGSSPKHNRPFTPFNASLPSVTPRSINPWELHLGLTCNIPSLGEPIWPERIAISPIKLAISVLTIFCWNTIIAFLASAYICAISLISSDTSIFSSDDLNASKPSISEVLPISIKAFAISFIFDISLLVYTVFASNP